MAGLAALMLAGRTNSGFPNAGAGYELDAIAAVIIGGQAFRVVRVQLAARQSEYC